MPEPDATPDPAERARAGVRAWVRESGRRTRQRLRGASPYAILAFLTASAVAPVAGAGLGASAAFTVVLAQLGGLGSNFLADILAGTAQRLRGTGPITEQQWRDAVAADLLPALAAGDEESRRLRAEVSAVLHEIDAVATALTEAADADEELRRQLEQVFEELGGDVGELHWMVTDVRRSIDDLRQQFAGQSLLLTRQLEQVRRQLLAVTGEPPPAAPAVASSVPPYPGLASFEPADAPWFRGRETQVAELLARLSEQMVGAPPLVVTGVSGAGKSSLLRAGLLPAIGTGRLGEAAAGWPWVLLTPGPTPLRTLVQQLSTLLTDSPAAPGVSEATSAATPGRTVDAAERGMGEPRPGTDADEPGAPGDPGEPGDAVTDSGPGGAGGRGEAVSGGVPAEGRLGSGESRAATLDELVAAVRREPQQLGTLARQAAARGRRPVIVVDQFEELFTQGAGPAERLAFAAALTAAAPALVVIAVRSDFYPACVELPPLAELLAAGHVVLGPLDAEAVRRAVVEPAEQAGLTVDPGLPELMLRDLSDGDSYEPGTLPLLAHALRATWERREGDRLTVEAYRATGGIRHAVAETAERIYLELDPDDRATLRTELLALVTVTGNGTVVRRRGERGAAGSRVLDRLVTERLVTAGADTVEISHEALLTGWPRLAGWVAEARADLELRQRVIEAAADWERSGRDPDLLLRGARLLAARERLVDRSPGPEPSPAGHTDPARDTPAPPDRETSAPPDRGTPAPPDRDTLAPSARDTSTPPDRDTPHTATPPAPSDQDGPATGSADRGSPPVPGTLPASAMAFVAAGVDAAEAAEAARRRATGRLRRLAAGLGVALLLAVAGGLVALNKQQVAADKEQEAQTARHDAASRQAAAEAVNALDRDEVTAVRRALDGWQEAHTAQARGALLSAQMVNSLGTLGTETGGHSVAFSPDGSRIAIGYGGGVVRLWDAVTFTPIGEPLVTPQKAARNIVVSVAFSPDGRFLMSSAFAKDSLQIWDAATGSPVRTLPGAAAAAWLPVAGTGAGTGAGAPAAGTVLALRTDPKATGFQLGMWDAATGRLSRSIPIDDYYPYDLAVSRDGKHVAITKGPGSAARVWRLSDGRAATTIPDTSHLAFAPDGTLVGMNRLGQLFQWEVPSGRRLRTLFEATSTPGASRFTVTADGMAVANVGSRLVATFSLADGTNTVQDTGVSAYPAVAASPDGRLIAVTGLDAPTAVFRRATTWLPHGGMVAGSSFSPDGRRLAAAADDGRIRVWDVASRDLVTDVRSGGVPVRVAFAAGGLLVDATMDAGLEVREAATGRLRETVPLAGATNDLAVSPDGSLVAVSTGPLPSGLFQPGARAEQHERILVYDVVKREVRTRLQPVEAPHAVAFSRDGTQLLATTTDPYTSTGIFHSALHAWRTSDFTRIGSYRLGDYQATDLAVSPADGAIAVAGTNGQVEFRSPDGTQPRWQTRRQVQQIDAIAFAPDGRTLAVSDFDGRIHLWDTASRTESATLNGHRTRVASLSFAPGSGLLASSELEGTFGLWRMDPAEVVPEICRVAIIADRNDGGGLSPLCR
ncbi:WD40 repeat protein [Actinoplanes octamycinicus]|uniref:WD40 repeat protein n=1 Tax=Actinoplanes octamycinicus TaxID=135948 RepID=A0A7W7M4G2_9ACTN|nr:AAA family ATPase [Actinoplanes octamycinicus]MBB4736667.1 WD40 repeat protein [Actinoplanes octamycinicus]GIE63127.1 hypothetical protein Aoc01nite_85290 [Actinoplanes octamycinicus]